MKKLLKFSALFLVLLLAAAALPSCVATAQPGVVVATGPGPYYGNGYGYRPRPYYRARPYYRPVPPRVVVVEPHRRVVAPVPRPYYNVRPHRYIRVR